MKDFGEFRTEMEQTIKDIDQKTKDWSNEDWERDWKKKERDTMMEYFEDLSTGNTDPYTDSCIYKNVFEENIQRRKKSQTEYITKVGKLYQDLKQKQGDEKLDTIGDLIKVIIQFQLFGMKP